QEPVTASHIGKHALESGGKYGRKTFQRPICILHKFSERFAMILRPVDGEEVVVENVDNDSGVVAIRRAQPALAFTHDRMAIRKFIDGAVQLYTPDDRRVKLAQRLTAF